MTNDNGASVIEDIFFLNILMALQILTALLYSSVLFSLKVIKVGSPRGQEYFNPCNEYKNIYFLTTS